MPYHITINIVSSAPLTSKHPAKYLLLTPLTSELTL